MKDRIRQIVVVLTILVTLIVNGLANSLPLNGLTTGDISDRFEVYFVPAGYVFSIWGLIYIGLIAFAIFQALPSQRDNPRLRATGWWIALGGVANSVWIFLWHYERFPLTLLAMLVLLATLIITYLRLGIGRTKVSTAEAWAVRVPFSIYLGWITVATAANVTSLLDYLNWGGFGIAPEIWMGIVLLAVLVIATFPVQSYQPGLLLRRAVFDRTGGELFRVVQSVFIRVPEFWRFYYANPYRSETTRPIYHPLLARVRRWRAGG